MKRYLALFSLCLLVFLLVTALHFARSGQKEAEKDEQAASSKLLHGGATETGTLKQDGSVKVNVLSCENKNFRISLRLNITNAYNQALDAKELEYEVMEDGKEVKRERFVLPTPTTQARTIRTSRRICLVLDYTLSMNGQRKIDAAKQAALALINFLNSEEDWLGIYCFNGTLNKNNTMRLLPMRRLTPNHRKWARDVITKTPLQNKTPMFAGMYQAAKEMAKYPGDQIMIVLTDGKDNDPRSRALKDDVIQFMKKHRIPAYMISFASKNKDSQLDEVAKGTGGQHLVAALPTSNLKGPSDVQKKFLEIGRKLKQQQYHLVEYDSPNTLMNGESRNVVVTVRAGKNGTQARASYDVGGVMTAGGAKKKPAATEEGKSGNAASTKEDKAAGNAPPLTLVFVTLGLVLLGLLAIPYFTWLRGGQLGEEPSPAASPAVPPASVISPEEAAVPAGAALAMAEPVEEVPAAPEPPLLDP